MTAYANYFEPDAGEIVSSLARLVGPPTAVTPDRSGSNIPPAGIINRGDSFRRRRSRSNSLCPPAMGGQTPSPVLDNHCIEVSNYTVALLGAQGVGKTALISQFMTSECINTYERQKVWTYEYQPNIRGNVGTYPR
ncbi:hypothetical protein GWI33_001324 [Rhynchophorus ferrugineus]|uniref:Uncharacterized protein n=1 Tax=Rhynchophorus ferrugineus TaxID=354439 RepID=A0A834M3G4_RHYFE|nr:hypothetical protein GWI33_001328 [Rhynchophorus ferrugineus]KAF7263714.1 hypothetical protein GWI33_001324 [Rhynchophorus ferrugineus]